MKYRCVIVDDEILARRLIQKHLAQLDDFELVASCASAIEASKILKAEKIDLLFLDIEMPILKGTEFFKNLIEKPKVIFTTAYRDFALDGFELNAVDYLLKPISFARFFKAIEKFLEYQKVMNTETKRSEVTKSDFIFIREDRKQVKLFFDDILYVESVKDYIKIVTEKGSHLIKQSLKSFEETLDVRFLRTHRSYIVNSHKITAYTKQDVEIEKLEIPIGDNYKSIALEFLKN
ncbi:LytTR family DNA-binding domain-containing protein [Flagellimonas sp. HMM57]|uniref:LytR/AlgR family response regulator transcription factor n=1 Tax=unclassified Flagellimonas TaxID=2644544 RepID=UPI0013D57DF9|nr:MULTISPECIES: LytTR family DNA-binding domain-containing protein [unclassified Flagellimonas]UII74742.1 LytTR family DNA-binding domain-containing protein [Flagellimonas sp. HMM57]